MRFCEKYIIMIKPIIDLEISKTRAQLCPSINEVNPKIVTKINIIYDIWLNKFKSPKLYKNINKIISIQIN